MALNRDSDGKFFTLASADEQSRFCDYVVIGNDRFYRENDYQKGTRLKKIDPKTSHVYGCNCFICNH